MCELLEANSFVDFRPSCGLPGCCTSRSRFLRGRPGPRFTTGTGTCASTLAFLAITLYTGFATFPRSSLTLSKAARVCLVLDCGCNGRGTTFVLPDFLRPFSTKDVGPSAMTRFHGGEMVFWSASASFRRFAGGPWLSSPTIEGSRWRPGVSGLYATESMSQLAKTCNETVTDAACLDLGGWDESRRSGQNSAFGKRDALPAGIAKLIPRMPAK